MANQIQLSGDFRREEALASGTVKPGMLLEVTSAGAVKAHATEGDYCERAFAVEDALQGLSVEDSYSDGDLVSYNLVNPGAEVNALLKAGEDVAVGEQLISAGDGTLISIDSADSLDTDPVPVAIAMEALALTDSGDEDTLMAVRVL